MVIFGAGGDLTWRKLIPALYNLHLDHHLPERFAIVGIARKQLDDEAFRRHLREGVDHFSRRRHGGRWIPGTGSRPCLPTSPTISAIPASGPALSQRLEELERAWGGRANRVFYLAIPPDHGGSGRGQHLEQLGVCRDCNGTAWWWRSRSAGTWRRPANWTGS